MPGEIKLWQHPTTGRHYITWTVGTRSYRRSTRETDIGEAQQVLAAFILEQGGRPPAQPGEVGISTLLDSYWERHAKPLPSAERIGIAIKHLKAFYGEASTDVVTARNHERYIEHCRREGKANGTINRHLGSLRAGLRFAVRSGDLSAAPHVPSLGEPPPRADVLDRKQVARLLRAARRLGHSHVGLFIRLAVYTGARRSAILQLTWDRVDLKSGIIDFRLPGVTHSRKRRAVTAVPARLLASLRRLHKRQPGDQVIQYHNARRDGVERTRRPVKGIRRAFREVAKAAKLPSVTPHVLKHTAVSWALRVASPWVVSGMTATSVKTLQTVYGKHMADDLKAAAEAVARSGITRKRRAKETKRRATKEKAKSNIKRRR